MATAAVIGDELSIEGYELVGVTICPAASEPAAVAAFQQLPTDTALLLLSAPAARWLAGHLGQRPDLLTVVMQA